MESICHAVCCCPALNGDKGLALGLAEPHELHMGPLLKLVYTPLDGNPSLRRVTRTTLIWPQLPYGAKALAQPSSELL